MNDNERKNSYFNVDVDYIVEQKAIALVKAYRQRVLSMICAHEKDFNSANDKQMVDALRVLYADIRALKIE